LLFISLSGYRYIGDGGSDRRDILHDGTYRSRTYVTLHKIVFRVPKITKTARTLYEITGVMWEYSYEGKHREKINF